MDWNTRLRSAFDNTTRTPDDDVVEELAQHAQAIYESSRAEGCSRAESERRVDLQISLWAADAAMLRRRARRTPVVAPPPGSSGSWTAGVTNDIRYAARLIRRQRAFTLLVAGTMALGIGATTTLFSVTHGVLMKPLPWMDFDRVVSLKETRGGHAPRFGAISNAAFIAWREEASTIEDIAAWSPRVLTLSGTGEPERIRLAAVSASLFPLLGVRPVIGSLFDEKDEVSQNAKVVVLSESLWRQRFGGDPGALGRLVQLDGEPHSVVGVLPDALAYPDRETRAWVPFRVQPATGNLLTLFNAIAKVRPGVTPAQAAAEGTARGRSAPDTGLTTMAVFGDNGPMEISAQPLRDALTADVRVPLIVLLVAVGLLLLTATANVASLQLARATTRRREMAIRAALGGGGRVTRQLLIESLLLGLAGGIAGLLVAALLHRALPSVLPADFPRLADVGLDGTVLGFATAVAVVTSIAFGLLPALRARRLNLVESLAEDGTAPIGGGRSRTARARMVIMAGQVAIASVLLVGASLLGRSFVALVNADRGFDPSNVLTARLQLPGFVFTPERRTEIVERILERLRGMPAVTAVTFSDGPPIGVYGGTAFRLDSRQVQAASRTIIPGYFAAMGIRIVDGRDFTDEDITTGRTVFIVNRTFARQYLSDKPVGQRVRGWVREGPAHWEIIGVVDDVRHRGVTEPAGPEVYRYRERDERRVSTSPTFILRTAGDPLALVPTLRAMARQQDESLVFDSVMTMEDRVLTGLARPRLYAILIAGFAAFALVIAAVGLFGVLSYVVAQRSRELAVRTALGARQADIIRLVLGQGLSVTVLGLTAGIVTSVFVTRAIAALLYGIGPHDALTYLVVPFVMLLASAIACAVPARRAARLDPLRVLKQG